VQGGGAAASSTVLSGGFELVSSGGTASATTLNGGTQYVSAGASASAATVNHGGLQYLFSGGTASGTTLGSGGLQYDYGTANGTTVSSGGVQYVVSGALASSSSVLAGGNEVVSAGGTTSGTVLTSGGVEIVSGTARGTVVSSGGYEVVVSGGAVSGATISGGLLEIRSGGTAGAGTIAFAGSGTLKLDNSVSFGGTLSGLATTAQVVDLADISYGSSTTFTFAGNSSSGTVTVSDGVRTAHLAVTGSYTAASFALYADGAGGTWLVDPVDGDDQVPSPDMTHPDVSFDTGGVPPPATPSTLGSSVTGDAALDRLVHAIASFAPATASQTALSAAAPANVAPTIVPNQQRV
jgi:autotransporter passenger strand-loop-strand repeat protein